MNHASLFSGIGGFDLAAEWMGWNNVFQVEIDPWSRRLLKSHFPNVIQYIDIEKFDGLKYEHSIDIISGGFPCQPFSVAGKQTGKEDNRYLWPEMLRVISEIKPTWVVGENVPGIISMALDTVLSDLEREGFTCQTFIIPACAVNAIHRRDRVWIIAYSDSNGKMRRSSNYEKESTRERIQERNEIQLPSEPDQISPSISSITENYGCGRWKSEKCTDVGKRQLFSRESKRGEVGSETSGCCRVDFLSNSECNGLSTSPNSRSTGKTIQEKSSREDESLNTPRKCNLSSSENDVSYSHFGGDKRYERSSSQETSAQRSSQCESGRSRRIRFPISQPSIRRGNDGLSYRMDNQQEISSNQRKKALKGLGNAVVPQVVYEIFRIIQEFEKEGD